MLINYGVNNKNLEGDEGFIKQVTIRNKEQYKRIDNNWWQCYYYDKDTKYLDAYKAITTEVLVGIICYYQKKKTRITYKCCTWDKIYSGEEQKGGEINAYSN